MNTPRLRREGRIASSSSFIFTCSGTPLVYFVCDSASELERWALLPLWVFPALTCFLFFWTYIYIYIDIDIDIATFRNLLHISSRVLGLSLGLYFIFSVPYFGLACNHGN